MMPDAPRLAHAACGDDDLGRLVKVDLLGLLTCDGGVTKKIVFSGDIGNKNQPLIKDPIYTKEADPWTPHL